MSDQPTGGPGSRRPSQPFGGWMDPNYGQTDRDASQQPLSGPSSRLQPAVSLTPAWDQPYDSRLDEGVTPSSPIDPTALQAALPPELNLSAPLDIAAVDERFSFDNTNPFMEDSAGRNLLESDRMPLTAGLQSTSNAGDSHPRDSFQTVSDLGNDQPRFRDMLHPNRDTEYGSRSPRRRPSYGMSLDPNEYHSSSRPVSSTSDALHLAGSIVRAMSQRVVNISGDEVTERQNSNRHSRSPRGSVSSRSRAPSFTGHTDTSYPSQTENLAGGKSGEQRFSSSEIPSRPHIRQPAPNPLKGRSLGIFGPDSVIRNKLCDVLVNPYLEPLILLLIVVQTVLLTIESAPNVFADGYGRPERWGQRWIDWAILGLFIIFTLEVITRIIVSGFILNASEYSTIDRKRGIRAAIEDQYRAVFQPQHKSQKASVQFNQEPSMISRSFTTLMQGQQSLPETAEEHQRFQLARRSFLRHSFNRLDFVAVVAYWISFILGITGWEYQHHLYVFKMLSCLRILRLLAITNGTAIILQSLKKAAPLLVRVAFLICFFWLLFAIVGLQSFKASFSRQCVWLDPDDPTNLTSTYRHDQGFCGGYRNSETGDTHPWVKMINLEGSLEPGNLANGSNRGKGFLCPRGSLCLEQSNPYNGTVSFDNIAQSLELVFVIMAANTFSDLMYWTIQSDYTVAALFFGSGVMVLTLWLINLLIAVITSSFQVIREESHSSAFTSEDPRASHLFEEDEYRRVPTLERMYEKSRVFWVVVIVFGLVSQAFRSSDMKSTTSDFVNYAEILVTVLLDIDIILRIAVNWRGFHRSKSNLFDLLLAVITSIILIPPIKESAAYPWLTVFQILRTYRVVLAIPVTRKLIMLVLGNAAGIANLMLFVFLMSFLAAILAAQLFRGVIPLEEGGEINNVSFYTLYNSFLGVYQVLTTESWTGILYMVTSNTTQYGTAWIGAIFLIGWFILSFFILVNMFIAVIQENFDVSEDEKRLEQVKAFLQRRDLGSSSSNLALSTIFSFGKARRAKDPFDHGPAMTEMLLKDAVVKEFLDEPGETEKENVGEHGPPQRSQTTLLGDVRPGFLSKIWGRAVNRIVKREPNPFYSTINFNSLDDTLDARQMAQQAVSAASTRRQAQREYLARHPTYNKSLYLFFPNHPIRRLCQRLVGPARGYERIDGVEPNKAAWYSFSAFVYAATLAMVIIACITTPLYQLPYVERDELQWYVWTDLAFAVVFTVESGIKVIADGLINTPNAYLRSSWGIVDTIVLITLWVNVGTLLDNNDKVSRATGAVKAFRALRLLNISNSARNTFHSLIIVGWWKLLGAAFISISLLIPFAIYGLNLFNGLMISCNDDTEGLITKLEDCFGEFVSTPYSDSWETLAPRVASNSYFRFDDFSSSIFTLFGITSQEGWTDVSFAAQAITGRGYQPQPRTSEANGIFFIIFNLMATVFVLTLFISVFMRNYTEQTGVAYLTAEQRSWLELRKLLRQISPSKSSYDDSGKRTWTRWCHKRAIEKRGKWYQTVTVVLVLHLVLSMIEFKGEPREWETTRSSIFLIFILIYVANIGIRIQGLGWTRFRRSAWDLYSLISVSGALAATIAVLIVKHEKDTFVQVHKYFLVGIVLLIIPRNDALDQLFKTAAASVSNIINLLATWLVLFLAFAIAFTQAFSLTRFGSEASGDCNFRTVPKAMILLFRLSFGEAWNAVMEDYAFIEPPFCTDDGNFFRSDCGSKPWARFLFVAWNILSMYLFVNLFVSLIYESFSYVYQRSTWVAAVDRDEIRRFKEAWRSVDPAGTGAISKETFPRLLSELSGVFQMRIYDAEDSIHQILDDIHGQDKRDPHASIATSSGYSNINLARLNERLALLDKEKIRERRRRFNMFYEEVLVSADPDRGVTFTGVLMILAHYNIINDSKSLKLDEFLRRRARLQRVEDSVRRKIVQGFFDTLYWSRKFKKHRMSRLSARMSTIPQLDIPDIMVDPDFDSQDDADKGQTRFSAPQATSTTHLSVDGKRHHSRKHSEGSNDGQPSAWGSSAWAHPLSFPRSTSSTPSPPLSPASFGFELREGSGQLAPSGELHRRTSSVSPSQAREMLDDSAWMESIRRSATTRRPNRRSS
ncbi:unnamed protein product [Clonostachys byssicola]|uniref:Calcium-channel protein CCH1 n=1 Tax=Clonostachys byssicola TaxID=160290 RepID=A0A9N9Y8H1_9HYPO|nr:unnamed protein product [Clonostachys byssicola]